MKQHKEFWHQCNQQGAPSCSLFLGFENGMKILWKMQSCQTVCVFCSQKKTVHDCKGLKQACVLYMSDPRVNKYLDKDSTLPYPQHSVIQMGTKCPKQRCAHYCAFLLNLLEDNPGLKNKLTMSDETYFHLTATVKRQNFCYQSKENAGELYE